MPILGQTDRASAPRKWMQLGTIRKGTRDGKGTPIDLPYFRFVPKQGPDAEDLQRIWDMSYGSQPTRIEILLPFDDVESNWQTWYEAYGTSGLKFRCNGKHWVQWIEPVTLAYVRDYATAQEKVCPYCSGATERTADDPGDNAVGYLTAILLPFFNNGYAGTVTVTTTSINDVMSVTGALYAAEDEARAHGETLRSIPFNLVRVEEEISQRFQDKNGAYHKKRGTKSMVHLMIDPQWAGRSLSSVKQSLAAPDMRALTTDEDPPMAPYDVMDNVANEPVDADFREETPQAPVRKETQTNTPPSNTRKAFSPMQVMQQLREHVEKRRGTDFEYSGSDRHKYEFKIRKSLEGVVASPEDMGAFLQFVIGENSFERMDDAEIETLRKYFVTKKVDNAWVLDAAVEQEVIAIVAEARGIQDDDIDEAEEALFAEAEDGEDSLQQRRATAKGLNDDAVARGLKPMSYTDETLDVFIATVSAMLSAQEEEAANE